MIYNLTDNQKQLARLLVEAARTEKLSESFAAYPGDEPETISLERRDYREDEYPLWGVPGTLGALDALESSKLIIQRIGAHNRGCTLTGLLYHAVDTDFAEATTVPPISTLAQPHPPEIAMSIDRLRERYPDQKKLGFLVMRFAAAKPFAKIVEAIQKVAVEHGLTVLRADAHEFHAGVFENVRTYLHGCGFGIAVYERIETNEPNANVGLEVGYLMAMNKPVLLLKDKTVPTLQTDLAGKLYKPFDPHDPEGTIPVQLTKWLEDYGIIVPVKK